MEPENNIGYICPDCVRKAYPKTGQFKPRDIEVGSDVKKMFTQDGKAEHMWVLVTAVYDDAIEGTLDSDPVLVTNIHYKDKVLVRLEEIEDIY